MNMDKPLISCVCLTRHRTAFLRRSIEYFLRQSFQDAELVVVHGVDDVETSRFLATLDHPRIRPVVAPHDQGLSLGELRNWGVRAARGEFIAIWDDDDYHAPHRLERQFAKIVESGKDSCFLLRWTVYDSLENRSYVTHPRNCEGTMICRKSVIPVYPAVNKAEDTALMLMLEESDAIISLDEPGLYVYVAHASNTWERSHFVERVMKNADELSLQQNEQIAALFSCSAA